MPILPDQFQTHIEHNFRSNGLNYTTEYDEYYDFSNNRGSVVKYVNQKLVHQYFLYETNELISITDLDCTVLPLNTSVGDNPYGKLDYSLCQLWKICFN